MAVCNWLLPLAAILLALYSAPGVEAQAITFSEPEISSSCGIAKGSIWKMKGSAVVPSGLSSNGTITLLGPMSKEICTINMDACAASLADDFEGCGCYGNSSLLVALKADPSISGVALEASWSVVNDSKSSAGKAPVIYGEVEIVANINGIETKIDPANATTLTFEEEGPQNISFCVNNLVPPVTVTLKQGETEVGTNEGGSSCVEFEGKSPSDFKLSEPFQLEYKEGGCARTGSAKLELVDSHASTDGATDLKVSHFACILPAAVLMLGVAATL